MSQHVSIPTIERDLKTLLFTGEALAIEERAARLKAIDEAVQIMEDLTHELHHQVHVPGCRCEYGVRKLRHAMAHLRAIHWAGCQNGVGQCARLDSGVDTRVVTCSTGTTLTSSSVASHYGNITCPVCRKIAWAAGVR